MLARYFTRFVFLLCMLLFSVQSSAQFRTTSDMVTLNGKGYLTLPGKRWQCLLWQTDGTPEGTNRLDDVNGNPVPATSCYPGFVQGRNAFYFSGRQYDVETEALVSRKNFIWKSDGTAENTRILVMHNEVTHVLNNDAFEMNGVLFYEGRSNGTSLLMRSDGTDTGTSILIRPDSSLDESIEWNSIVRQPDSEAFFVVVSKPGNTRWSRDYRVVRSDGTVAGTTTISTDAKVSELFGWTNNKLIVRAAFDGVVAGLWAMDVETGAVELLIEPVKNGTGSVGNEHMAHGLVYFVAYVEGRNYVLMVTDGTPQGTRVLTDSFNAVLQELTRTNRVSDDTYFYFPSGTSPFNGFRLGRTDGTQMGTTRLDTDADPVVMQSLQGSALTSAGIYYVGMRQRPADHVGDWWHTISVWYAEHGAEQVREVSAFPSQTRDHFFNGMYGVLDDVAIVSGWTTNSRVVREVWRVDPDSKTKLFPLARQGELAVDVTASVASVARVGQRIDYTYTVTSETPGTTNEVVVSSSLTGGPICVIANLAPFETGQCNITYFVRATDIRVDNLTSVITNTATVVSNDFSEPVNASVDVFTYLPDVAAIVDDSVRTGIEAVSSNTIRDLLAYTYNCRERRQARKEAGQDRRYSRSCIEWASGQIPDRDLSWAKRKYRAFRAQRSNVDG